MSGRWVLAVLFSALIACGSFAVAQTGGKQGNATKQKKASSSSRNAATGRAKPSKPKRDSTVTASREAGALTFARLHHPQLSELLAQLKKHNRPEYERAIRQLFQTSERLARIKDRIPDRYELELEAWKLESRIRLLGAKLTMSDDPGIEAELKAALLDRVDLRLQQMQAERRRLAERLQKLDKLIEQTEKRLQDGPDELAEKDLQRMKKGLGARISRPKRPVKPKSKAGTTQKRVGNSRQTNRPDKK